MYFEAGPTLSVKINLVGRHQLMMDSPLDLYFLDLLYRQRLSLVCFSNVLVKCELLQLFPPTMYDLAGG